MREFLPGCQCSECLLHNPADAQSRLVAAVEAFFGELEGVEMPYPKAKKLAELGAALRAAVEERGRV